MMTATDSGLAIAFQGEPGAYSHSACRNACPEMVPLPCATFEDAFAAVREGRARTAMIPIDNSLAGRVADVHHLMPHAGLHIVAEHFERISHHLLALPGTRLENVRSVESHVHALGQCRRFIREHGLSAVVGVDTAGAAADIARSGDPSRAAIASALAGEIYGLESLAAEIEDAPHNTTRFVVLAEDGIEPDPGCRRSPASCSASATFPPRCTRRWAASPPTASTSPSWRATWWPANSSPPSSMSTSRPIPPAAACAWRWRNWISSATKSASSGVYPAHPFRLAQRAAGE